MLIDVELIDHEMYKFHQAKELQTLHNLRRLFIQELTSRVSMVSTGRIGYWGRYLLKAQLECFHSVSLHICTHLWAYCMPLHPPFLLTTNKAVAIVW